MSIDAGVRFTYLGHSTFVLTGPGDRKVLIDPWVMGNPRCPEDQEVLDGLDAVLITHGHPDHMGDAVEVFERYQPSAIVGIFEIAQWLQSKGIPEDRVVPMNKGGTVDLGGVKATMVHAIHSGGIQDGDRIVYGGEPAGYVIEFENGSRVYHAGDTLAFSDMKMIRELHAPEIAMLPIGDHFTMGPREAALACEFLGVDTVIPMHYGTFPVLTGTPEQLREECEARGLHLEVVAVEPGESVE